ncbi:hypothetical protein [Poseidonibacter ostreae]|uniref:hypothetical protein n=1 Tax=Poseidonibacter ostreae TaxID=2654171 RepID=UPI00186B06B2|nr:hypothetical protein [Poseidonibacter ostreae]
MFTKTLTSITIVVLFFVGLISTQDSLKETILGIPKSSKSMSTKNEKVLVVDNRRFVKM